MLGGRGGGVALINLHLEPGGDICEGLAAAQRLLSSRQRGNVYMMMGDWNVNMLCTAGDQDALTSCAAELGFGRPGRCWKNEEDVEHTANMARGLDATLCFPS